MQIMTIEFARNVLGYRDANSSEFDLTTKYPVISIMEEQKNVVEKGGTYEVRRLEMSQLKPNTTLLEIYGAKNITERHRHRYEFNSEFLEDFENNGLQALCKSRHQISRNGRAQKSSFYVGVQYHQNIKVQLATPHPLFIALIKAQVNNKLVETRFIASFHS